MEINYFYHMWILLVPFNQTSLIQLINVPRPKIYA
jgi:hypothetical protein